MSSKITILFFLITFCMCSVLIPNQFGAGIILGAPTGLSFKYWQYRRSAFDFAVAWNFSDDYFHIHGDYLIHFPFDVEEVAKDALYWYFGGGVRIRVKGERESGDESSNNLGIRGVMGLDYIHPEVPVDFFIELAPVMEIISSTGLELEGGIGVRYNFNL
jgi:hypothetical protein